MLGRRSGFREALQQGVAAWHIALMIRQPSSLMTMFSTARLGARDWHVRGHMTPVLLAGGIAVTAVALVVYLLWPTWRATGASSTPERLPISVGGALFNVPTAAVRMKIQRHSGSQERVDLAFDFPSLNPPDGPRHVTAETAADADQAIERMLFLSIAAHHDAMAPEARLRTIYPHYLDQAPASVADGLTMRTFRDGTSYAGEDLFLADGPDLAARCTRDAATPGMCLSERRIDGADLIFRFPRSWLAQWREVANAMERLTAQLHGARG
jgi:hypothetical protein